VGHGALAAGSRGRTIKAGRLLLPIATFVCRLLTSFCTSFEFVTAEPQITFPVAERHRDWIRLSAVVPESPKR